MLWMPYIVAIGSFEHIQHSAILHLAIGGFVLLHI